MKNYPVTEPVSVEILGVIGGLLNYSFSELGWTGDFLTDDEKKIVGDEKTLKELKKLSKRWVAAASQKRRLEKRRPKVRRPSRLTRAKQESVGETVTFSVMKASEGGLSFNDAADDLRSAGIGQVFKGHSPYVGHYGIIVPKKFEKKARRILHL